jgi:lactate racemase
MHRPSTEKERVEMMGKEIAERYLVVDHKAENENELVKIEGQSRGGADVFLNKHYVNAGFRIVTGLVEPHFMAGFSGGRKSVCPGLVSLSAVKNFHGYDFLSDTGARNGNLENNPCHEESVSIEKLCPADFSIHIVQDNLKNINKVFSGDITKAHQAAVEYVKKACCREVKEHADLVLTSCGGYPLDATFYQCVKGFVSCLPAVRTKGEIIAFGSCSEGTGSMEYGDTMKKYAGRHNEFLEHIKKSDIVVKDQWQFQMHARALSKISKQNLYFFTSGITKEELKMFSVNPQSVNEAQIQPFIQDIIKVYARMGKKIAAFPEGPYCAPV